MANILCMTNKIKHQGKLIVEIKKALNSKNERVSL